MNVPKLRFKEFNDEWNYIKLGDYCSLITKGTTPNKFSSNGINFIKIESLSNYSINNDLCLCVDEKIHNTTLKRSILEEKDVLFAIAGATIGKCGIVEKNNLPANTNQALAILRVKQELLNPYFLLNILDSRVMKKYIFLNISIGAQPNLNLEQINNFKFNIPTKIEQDKIMKIINLINQKIELQAKKIEDLKLFKKGLLENIFKEEYTKVCLKDILKERKLYSEKGLEYPHVTLSKDGIYDKGDRYNRDFLVKSEDKQYKITKLNDLCYNPANLKFGVICLNEYGSAIFSPIYVTFEINKKINPKYIKYYTTRNNFINAVRKFEQGTVYERMAVSPEDFLKFNIKLPNLEVQNSIVNNIELLDKKISYEILKVDSLIKIKKGLMQNMFV